MAVRAYAKINLGLRVLRKRQDGYHDIETVMHRINLFDDLTFKKAEAVSMTSTDLSLPCDESNLCIRAVRLLQEHFKVDRGAHIDLKKNIPIGAGLGGGSADAAETLRGVCKLWGLKTTTDELAELALQLGSDVPYFLQNGTAYATGRGEILEPLPMTLPYWIVVVFPGVHISTAWAYNNVILAEPEDAPSLKDILLNHIGDLSKLSSLVRNDFQAPVTAGHPKVPRLMESLRSWGAEFVQLSGSGSSVYGLFRDKAGPEKFYRRLYAEYTPFITPPHFKIKSR